MDEPKEAHHNKRLQFWLPTCLGIQLHSILLSSSVRPKKCMGAHFIASAPALPPTPRTLVTPPSLTSRRGQQWTRVTHSLMSPSAR